MSLKNSVAIIGAAESDIGRLPHMSEPMLHMQGIKRALDDCGLTNNDVDGIFGPEPHMWAEYVGIRGSYIDGTMVGGGSFILLVQHAAAAIQAGLCNVAVVSQGASGYSRVGTATATRIGTAAPVARVSGTIVGQYEDPYGTLGPTTLFPHSATRHMIEFGTTREMFSAVSVATRQWATLNPRATMRDPITIEDVMNSRPVVWPFNLLHCCLVSDAGGAVVVVSAERARSMSLKKKPVFVLGSGEYTTHQMMLVSQTPDFARPIGPRKAGELAFRMAGVSHSDIDHVQIYDAFAHNPIQALEALGFLKPGEGGPFFAEMHTAPGGDFPLNTNGGGLSYAHPGAYGMLNMQESIRQLRGGVDTMDLCPNWQNGEHTYDRSMCRQVENCRISLAFGPAGFYSTNAILILGTE